MSVSKLLVLVVVAAAVLMLVGGRARLFALVGLVAAAAQALMAFGIIQLRVSGLNLPVILALALLVSGIAVWINSGDKTTVTASSVVTLVGAIQLAGALL